MDQLLQKINNLENRLSECEVTLKFYNDIIKSLSELPKTRIELKNIILNVLNEREKVYFENNKIPSEIKELIQAGILITGPPGHEGPPGKEGIQGKPGVMGLPGIQGKEGKMGKKGIDGRDGTNGIDGIDGKNGDKGPSGDRGPIGPRGRKGPNGDVNVPFENIENQIEEMIIKILNNKMHLEMVLSNTV
jgi:hypothetical protein